MMMFAKNGPYLAINSNLRCFTPPLPIICYLQSLFQDRSILLASRDHESSILTGDTCQFSGSRNGHYPPRATRPGCFLKPSCLVHEHKIRPCGHVDLSCDFAQSAHIGPGTCKASVAGRLSISPLEIVPFPSIPGKWGVLIGS